MRRSTHVPDGVGRRMFCAVNSRKFGLGGTLTAYMSPPAGQIHSQSLRTGDALQVTPEPWCPTRSRRHHRPPPPLARPNTGPKYRPDIAPDAGALPAGDGRHRPPRGVARGRSQVGCRPRSRYRLRRSGDRPRGPCFNDGHHRRSPDRRQVVDRSGPGRHVDCHRPADSRGGRLRHRRSPSSPGIPVIAGTGDVMGGPHRAGRDVLHLLERPDGGLFTPRPSVESSP